MFSIISNPSSSNGPNVSEASVMPKAWNSSKSSRRVASKSDSKPSDVTFVSDAWGSRTAWTSRRPSPLLSFAREGDIVTDCEVVCQQRAGFVVKVEQQIADVQRQILIQGQGIDDVEIDYVKGGFSRERKQSNLCC